MQHVRVFNHVFHAGGLGSIGLGSLGTFSGKSIAIKTAADRAAEAAARIPDPAPRSPRVKRKSVSFVDDGELTRIRYFLKVCLLSHTIIACAANNAMLQIRGCLQRCSVLCMHVSLEGKLCIVMHDRVLCLCNSTIGPMNCKTVQQKLPVVAM